MSAEIDEDIDLIAPDCSGDLLERPSRRLAPLRAARAQRRGHRVLPRAQRVDIDRERLRVVLCEQRPHELSHRVVAQVRGEIPHADTRVAIAAGGKQRDRQRRQIGPVLRVEHLHEVSGHRIDGIRRKDRIALLYQLLPRVRFHRRRLSECLHREAALPEHPQHGPEQAPRLCEQGDLRGVRETLEERYEAGHLRDIPLLIPQDVRHEQHAAQGLHAALPPAVR